MRRQPKARGTKSKSRVDAFYETKDKATTKVGSDDKLHADIQMTRLGSKILELKKVSKAYGELNLFHDFTYTFKKKDRVGIIGKNGSGKTTLLKMIVGTLTPDQGKVVLGETTVIGYYSQDGIKIEDGKRVIEVIKDIAEFIPISKGRTISAVSDA
jgi:ABC transport system ATP-binding/permease protein